MKSKSGRASLEDRYAAMRKPKAPEISKEAILDAAISTFARSGFEGAKMEEIASMTSVNKRMVYYYFGSKEDLYIAALERVYECIREHEKGLNLADLAPAMALDKVTESTFDYYVGHPDFVRLIAIENILRGRLLKRSTAISQVNSQIIKTLDTILRRGAEAGIFRDDVEPVGLHRIISGFSFFQVANQHTFSHIFEYDMISVEALERARRDLIGLVHAHVSPN